MRKNLVSHSWIFLFSILLATVLIAQNTEDGKKPATLKDKRSFQKSDPSIRLTQEKIDKIAQTFSIWSDANDMLQKSPELWHNKQITSGQILSYGSLKSLNPEIEIRWNEKNGTPIFISGRRLALPPDYATPQSTAARNARAARFFLLSNASLLKIDLPEEEFHQIDYQSDQRGRVHIRFQQTYRGLDVWGKEVLVHIGPDGNIDLFTGRYEPTPNTITSIDAGINSSDAVQTAFQDVQNKSRIEELSPSVKKLLEYDGPVVQKIIFCDYATGAPHLAYMVEIRPNFIDRWRYFIDAVSGQILFQYNSTCYDGPTKANAKDLNNVTRSIDTYQFNNQFYLIDATRPMFNSAASVFPDKTVGTIWTIDARNSDLKNLFHVMSANNTWTDAASVSAHYNAATTYEYFRQTHNRNSIDGRGSSILSAIHVTQQNQAMDNAFWNGRLMAYGDGAQITKSWPGALDAGAHEMTHGVTENTANLEYLFQSGALNESFSDIFAAMVDRDDWKMFEDIALISEFPSGALRDLSNPHNGGAQLGDPGWQPAHMNEYLNFDKSRDNGGVHYNSGIPNKAAYLLATAITREKAEKIAYCALTTKLTKQSQFIDSRLAMVKCAEELYGNGSAESQAVKNSFDQVGILDAGGTKKPDDIPAVNGPDKMLLTSTDPNDPFYLWIATPPAQSANDFSSLTQTSVLRKPTVADDGSIAVFVDGDKKLRVIALNPMAPREEMLDAQPIWNNCALSRDAKLLSATTTLQDTALYVFDVSTTTPRGKKFALQTPSYSDTPVPNTVVFADAMDFTYDKQVLLYDSFNTINISGFNYEFWEINALNVWDKSKNDFGNGQAMRIFPFTPGISIGNPAVAKTKPTVFAFDLQDPTAQTTEIMAVDVNTGVVTKVATGSYPDFSYPGYSGNDQILSYGAASSSGLSTIYNVAMANDGITPTSAASPYIVSAKFPVWYRIGKRPVSVEKTPITTADGFVLQQNYPNPFSPGARNIDDGMTNILYSTPRPAHVTLIVYDIMGREIVRLVDANIETGIHGISWNGKTASGLDVPSGMYFYRLTLGPRAITRKMLIKK